VVGEIGEDVFLEIKPKIGQNFKSKVKGKEASWDWSQGLWGADGRKSLMKRRVPKTRREEKVHIDHKIYLSRGGKIKEIKSFFICGCRRLVGWPTLKESKGKPLKDRLVGEGNNRKLRGEGWGGKLRHKLVGNGVPAMGTVGPLKHDKKRERELLTFPGRRGDISTFFIKSKVLTLASGRSETKHDNGNGWEASQ